MNSIWKELERLIRWGYFSVTVSFAGGQVLTWETHAIFYYESIKKYIDKWL